jgi:type I restriction enzyme, S subunit
MGTNDTQLPSNWACVSLFEVCDITSGCGFPESLQGRQEGDIPFFKVADISEAWKSGQIRLEKANNYISREEARALKANPLPAACIVFAKIGPSIALNRRIMLGVPGIIDNNVMGLIPNAAVVDPLYLFYFSCTLRLDTLAHPAKVPFIRKSAVGRIQIPLPPLPEQQRIAANIAARLERLHVAASGLKSVQEGLLRQRSAILQAACTGQLVPTEAEVARKEAHDFESAQTLVQKARLANFSRSQQKDSNAAKLSAKKSALPEGWTWIKVRDLGDDPDSVIRSGPYLRSQDFDEKGVPVLNVGCVRWGEFDESKLNRLSERKAAEFRRYCIKSGDILFTRTGSIGRCAVATERQAGWLLTDHILRTRVDQKTCVPDFVAIAFEYSTLGGHGEERAAAVADARLGLNKQLLGNSEIPLPPFAEQVRIVAEVERRMVHLNALQAAIRASLERSKELRHWILENTFAGKCLAESASVSQNRGTMALRGADGAHKEALVRA